MDTKDNARLVTDKFIGLTEGANFLLPATGALMLAFDPFQFRFRRAHDAKKTPPFPSGMKRVQRC